MFVALDTRETTATTTLADLRQAVAAYTAGFDVNVIDPDDLHTVMADATAIKNMACLVESLTAARLADTDRWRARGDKTPGHDLARRTGTSVAKANEQIAAARRLHQLATADQAARQGKLSADQLAVITDAASADPDTEQHLVQEA